MRDSHWVETGLALVSAATRWRGRVDEALEPVGLSFNEFVVLRATDQLCRELDDAVSQKEVANRAGLTEMATSRVMRRLDSRGLVSRGPSFGGLAWRVFVCETGVKVLRECESRIERDAFLKRIATLQNDEDRNE